MFKEVGYDRAKQLYEHSTSFLEFSMTKVFGIDRDKQLNEHLIHLP